MRILGFALLLTCTLITRGFSQSEGDLGAWYMYVGANRISEKFSIHSEAQFRFYKVAQDRHQYFLRFGLNWHVSDQVIITQGYGYFLTWDPLDSEQLRDREHRIFEQLIVKSPIGRLYMDHRYRIEQRWIGNNGKYDLKNRARYRIYTERLLNKASKEQGTISAVGYNEIFLNMDKNSVFDQNRLYFAFGYYFSRPLSVQIGYMLITIPAINLSRLQFTVYYNPDLRKQ